MASLLYALIANETSPTPLVEVSLATGNSNLVALQILRQVKPNSSMSYNYQDQYMFHTYNEDGLTFICLSDSEFPPHAAYGFLFDIREQFLNKYGEQRKAAIGLSANDFSKLIKERMTFFNKGSYDHLTATEKNIQEAHKVMIENLERVLSRGQKIELLVDKTELISDRAVVLRRTGTKVKHHYWWKNLKMSLMLIAVLCAIGLVIVLVVCGGIRFPEC